MASKSSRDTYWVANDPNCEITDAKALNLTMLYNGWL